MPKLLYAFLFILAFMPIHAQETFAIDSVFSKDTDGWTGSFTDYPSQAEAFYELSWGWENLPQPVDSLTLETAVQDDKVMQNFDSELFPRGAEHSQKVKAAPIGSNYESKDRVNLPSSTAVSRLTKGLFISGNNHSDDLFMYFKKEISGLKPNTEYALVFSVILETNIPKGLIGIGGSPGESLYVKIGASSAEPLPVIRDHFYYLNVDKGNQSSGGANAIVIGNLANEAVNPHSPQYQPKTLSNPNQPLVVKTDSQGRLWIFIGVDSGFEGITKFYLAKISLHGISGRT